MDFISSFKIISTFFLKQEMRTKRAKIFIALTLIPVIILLIAKINHIANPVATSAEDVFSNALLVIYIQLIVPVISLFYGSMIISDEMDNKTLIFLTTSPVPKTSIIASKFASYTILSSVIISMGFLLCYLIVNLNHLTSPERTKEFLSFVYVSLFAILAYSAIFTLVGAIFRKPVLIGFFFVFGWESIVQYIPGLTQKFTVMHWLKSLLPQVPEGGEAGFLKMLIANLEPASKTSALFVLFTVSVIALIASCYVFQRKEYIMADSE